MATTSSSTQEQYYRYKINKFQLINENNDIINLDQMNIPIFEIIKDFDNFIKPIINLSVVVDTNTKIWINKYWKNVYILLSIQSYKTTYDSTDSLSVPITIIDGKFRLLYDIDNTYHSEKNQLYRDAVSQNSSAVPNEFETMNGESLLLSLYDDELDKKINTIVDTIFTKTDLQHAVLYLMSKCRIKNLLMNPITNSTIYEELFVPPVSLYAAISYLDREYALFKKGMMLFFDTNITYLLDVNDVGTVFIENESPRFNFNIYNFDSDKAHDCMTKISNNSYTFLNINNINIQFKDKGQELTQLGSTVKIINVDNDILRDSMLNMSDLLFPNTTVYSYTTTNDQSQSVLSEQLYGLRNIIEFIGFNYDMTAFTPNKEYILVYDSVRKIDSTKPMKYRLSSVKHGFTNRGSYYQIATSGILQGVTR